MKLIRWLLSNIILIAFVLALTYAYVYWDNLTGEDTPAGKLIAYLSVEYDEVREFLDAYDFDSVGTFATDETGAAAPEPEPVARVAETASVPQVMPPPRTQPRPPVQQPAPPQAMTQQPPVRQQSGAPQVPPQAMIMQPPATRQPAPVQREPAPVLVDPVTETAVDKPALSARELWISAREEFHRGNIDQSIRNYQQVIANSSDNYDAYGELGNVYLSRNKYREAAGAYFEAAAILVKLGEINRARSLVPLLGQLDRSKADELNQLINSPGS